MTRPRPALVPIAAGVLGAAVLFANARARIGASDLDRLLPGWRGWDDLAIAAGEHQEGDFPVAPYRIADSFRRNSEDAVAFRSQLEARTAADGIAPAQFWRTLGEPWLTPRQWLVVRRFDDSGRAALLGLGFRLLGGTAPFLLPWLAVLAALPVVLWMATELAGAGRPAAAVVFGVLVGCSAFVLDILMLGYAAAGFQLVALLALAAFSTYAALARPTLRGLAARAVATAVVIASCAFCRSATLLLLPAFAVALAVGTWRGRAATNAGARRRGAAMAALATAIGGIGACLALYLALVGWTGARLADTGARHGIRRQFVQAHDVWITFWQGLGDFDRTKGHIYLDKAGEDAALRAGAYRRLGRRTEVRLRDVVFDEIREDPGWFAAILARRTWATVTLRKLWPRLERDGTSIVPAATPNEGVTDRYYELIAQADWFALGTAACEAPPWLLLGPALALGTLALVPRSRTTRFGARLAAAAGRARSGLPVIGCLALGALATPVLITTASGFEMQMFVLVHLLALALLVDAVGARPAAGATTPRAA